MDCDFSHDPKDLDKLYRACKYEGADVAVGSRYVKGGKVENWPALRVAISKGASIYTRMLTFMPVKDPTAGFVCYRNYVLDAINFDEISFVGYAFQIEMKFAAWKLGFKIKEVPITFIDRQFGVSKMNKGIVKEGIFGVLQLKWMSMFKNYRRRVKSNDVVFKNEHELTA
jgi:dolichol-phosphate mannosyltransferase